jgi:hypothetical protein
MRLFVRCLFGFSLVALAASMGGCGPRYYEVKGKVSYNGAVLDKPDGKIIFVGSSGEQAMAPIGKDGTYSASNVLSGDNKVVVYYPNPEANKGRGKKLGPGDIPPPPVPLFLTPLSYGREDTTDLKLNVTKSMEYNAEMTGPAIP